MDYRMSGASKTRTRGRSCGLSCTTRRLTRLATPTRTLSSGLGGGDDVVLDAVRGVVAVFDAVRGVVSVAFGFGREQERLDRHIRIDLVVTEEREHVSPRVLFDGGNQLTAHRSLEGFAAGEHQLDLAITH